MGITLASNFDVNAALPLDSRMVVADLTARDAIDAGRRYAGMTVYVVADTITYQLKGGILNADWTEYGSGASAIAYVETFSGDGVTLTFTLATDPIAIENTQVYVDGVYQQKTASYNLNTPDIEFVDAPPTGTDNIEVVYMTPASPLVIPDDYITTAKILDGAVTDAKITSMDAAKLTGTLNALRIATGSLDGSVINTGTITSTQLSSNSISTAKIADAQVTDAKITKIFTSSAVTSFSTTSFSFVDVTNATHTITRISGKQLKFTLIAPLLASVSYVSGVNFDIQLVRDSTAVGVHRVNFNSGADICLPLSMFTWYEDSATGTATYKLQMRDNVGGGVTINNFRFLYYYV